jgi:hypothetical protein
MIAIARMERRGIISDALPEMPEILLSSRGKHPQKNCWIMLPEFAVCIAGLHIFSRCVIFLVSHSWHTHCATIDGQLLYNFVNQKNSLFYFTVASAK